MFRRFVFLGAGAIGAGIGAMLALRGQPVLLIARGAHGEALRRGVDLRLPAGPRRVDVPVGDMTEIGREDLVILCTMGQDSTGAIEALPEGQPIVSFQNGITPLEAIQNRPLVAGMVFVPAERRAPGVVAMAGHPVPGAIFLGGWPRGLVGVEAALAEALADAGFRAEVFEDIGPWIRAKSLANLGGTLIALCDAPPVELLAILVAEAQAVFAARGESVIGEAEFAARIGPFETVAVDGLPRVGGSTRHSLARGGRLETGSLHGWFVEEGARLGVPTPANAALIAVAQRAERERWTPGAMAGEELLRLCT